MSTSGSMTMIMCALCVLALGSSIGFVSFRLRKQELALSHLRARLESDYASVEDMWDTVERAMVPDAEEEDVALKVHNE